MWTSTPTVCGRSVPEDVELLQTYFHHEMYSGRRFEWLDGDGDQPTIANCLTGTDLATLPLLSVRLTRGNLVIDLLEAHAERISEMLAAIPPDVALWIYGVRYGTILPTAPGSGS